MLTNNSVSVRIICTRKNEIEKNHSFDLENKTQSES